VRELVARMENNEIDILIGTQIVAKGHNFPNLTFVGVVDADLGLKGGDLRAGERTFQLVSQVAGRAGRHEKKGRALIQTYAPQEPVMQALAAQDRDAFFAAEIAEREAAGMPPYGRLRGGDRVGAERATRELRPRRRWGRRRRLLKGSIFGGPRLRHFPLFAACIAADFLSARIAALICLRFLPRGRRA
jgi:superfamily II DNA/RNA helicase